MRSAKEQEFFPYTSKTVCYILVTVDGNVVQVQHSAGELQAAYDAVCNKKASLYAVWPGNWRSDLFIIDDMEAFADALGLTKMNEEEHIHDITWKFSEYGDDAARYALIDCQFKCNCNFWKMNLKKFAKDMCAQKGWNVATSKGCSGHSDIFSVYVRRDTLR